MIELLKVIFLLKAKKVKSCKRRKAYMKSQEDYKRCVGHETTRSRKLWVISHEKVKIISWARG